MSVRLNINLSEETANQLKSIADEKGITYTEAVRRAIEVMRFFEDEKAKGRTILTCNRKHKQVRELIIY